MADDQQTLTGTLADTAGLTLRGQLEWAKWQAFYMPSTWKNIAQEGVKWRGFVFGGTASKLASHVVPESIMGYLNPVLSGGNFGKFTADIGSTNRVLNTITSRLEYPKFTVAPFAQQKFNTVVSESIRKSLGQASTKQLFEIVQNKRGLGISHAALTEAASQIPVMRWNMIPGGAASSMGVTGLLDAPGIRRGQAAMLQRSLMRGAGIQMAGRIMSAANVAILAGTAASIGAGVGFFAARTAIALTHRAARNNYLDFGDGLYAASMTAGSITERQRALQEMQRNNMNARRAIGNEAAHYA